MHDAITCNAHVANTNSNIISTTISQVQLVNNVGEYMGPD